MLENEKIHFFITVGDFPDVLPSCKSVVVYAKKFLNGTLKYKSTIPYTIVRNILSDRMEDGCENM